MIYSIIIGFEYKNSVHQEIPGTQYDILRMYHIMSHFSDQICIITDINKFDSDIIDNIKKIDDLTVNIDDKLLYKYQEKDDFIEKLNNISLDINTDIICLYYSGHGEKGLIITPEDNDGIESTIFIDIFNKSEIFIIFDCCHPSTLSLPFKLNNNKWKLQDEYKVRKNNILLLTCADEDNEEKAVSSRYGSIFTRIFFNYIKKSLHSNRNLSHIVHKIMLNIYEERNKYIQNINFYSSKYVQLILPIWFNMCHKISSEYYFDYEINCLIIKK